ILIKIAARPNFVTFFSETFKVKIKKKGSRNTKKFVFIKNYFKDQSRMSEGDIQYTIDDLIDPNNIGLIRHMRTRNMPPELIQNFINHLAVKEMVQTCVGTPNMEERKYANYRSYGDELITSEQLMNANSQPLNTPPFIEPPIRYNFSYPTPPPESSSAETQEAPIDYSLNRSIKLEPEVMIEEGSETFSENETSNGRLEETSNGCLEETSNGSIQETSNVPKEKPKRKKYKKKSPAPTVFDDSYPWLGKSVFDEMEFAGFYEFDKLLKHSHDTKTQVLKYTYAQEDHSYIYYEAKSRPRADYSNIEYCKARTANNVASRRSRSRKKFLINVQQHSVNYDRDENDMLRHQVYWMNNFLEKVDEIQDVNDDALQVLINP
ncbi:CLUMA_CG003461, isoform A, partial [Clunio marinus]